MSSERAVIWDTRTQLGIHFYIAFLPCPEASFSVQSLTQSKVIVLAQAEAQGTYMGESLLLEKTMES